MKVEVSKLKPNPYRRINEYEIDREKVEELKMSINDTSFWDNLLARKHGNEYQIAYGHHRLEALKELKIKEIDIPVRNIDDGMMIKIMANENRDTYKANRSVMIETIKVAREFLRGQLNGGWGDLDKSIRVNFLNEHAFDVAKGMGVGKQTIQKFLGGNWKEWEIQEALAQLDVDKAVIEPKALDQFESLSTAKEARQAFQEFKIPKSKQTALAKELKKKEIPVKQMRSEVADIAWKSGYTKPPKKEKEYPELPSIDEFANKTIAKMGDASDALIKIRGKLKHIKSSLDLMMFNTSAKGLKKVLDTVLEELETLKIKKGDSDGKAANIQENRKRIG